MKKSRISFHKVTKFHDSFIFKISTRGLQAVLVCPKQTCYPLVGIVYNPMPLPFLYGSTVLLMDENSLLNCSLNHSPISCPFMASASLDLSAGSFTTWKPALSVMNFLLFLSTFSSRTGACRPL